MEEKRYDMLNSSDREEEIRIKKIKQGLIPDTENEQYQKEKEERENAPMTLEEKWKNFWYHNKVFVLIFGFIIVFGGIFTFQSIFKEVYDTTILFCTYSYYDDATLQKLSSSLEEVMPDMDGNGEVNVGVFQASYTAPGEMISDTKYEQALQSRVMAEIYTGENCIFICQKEYMDYLAENDVFADLRDVLGLEGDKPIYSISIADAPILKDKAFDKERDNFHIGIRIYKEGTDKKAYDAQVNAVKAVVASKTK